MLLLVGVLILVMLTEMVIAPADPPLDLISPANNIWTSFNNDLLNFTFQHGAASAANCSLRINLTAGVTTNVGTAPDVPGNVTIAMLSNTSFPPGALMPWFIRCQVGQDPPFNSPETRFFGYDTTPPGATMSVPLVGQQLSVLTLINGTITDTGSGVNAGNITIQVKNGTGACLHWASNIWNSTCNNPSPAGTTPPTDWGPATYVGTTFTLGSINSTLFTQAGNQYNLTISSYDLITPTYGNPNQQLFYTNFLMDTTPPTANILNNSFTSTSSSVEIWFNCTDDLAATSLLPKLYMGGVLRATGDLINNNTNGQLTATSLSNGDYTTYVECTDMAGNLDNSTSITVTVNVPAVPEFSDYAIILILVVTIGGFLVMRKKEN